MIKLEKTDVFGWEAAIRGMRNPMNSWDKSDSKFFNNSIISYPCELGENDLDLMKKLVKAGNDHAKFLRMINVTVDITAPLYWWKEFDTYKVGTVANSCSTMHKIHEKEFTLDDFSHEHLDSTFVCAQYSHISKKMKNERFSSWDILYLTIKALNYYRSAYLKSKNKYDWWQMIQLLPSSYNQKRTVQLNYAVLKNIYFSRRNHKLDEWHTLCDWIRKLPCSEIITCEHT